MVSFLIELVKEIVYFFNEISVYLLLGFFVAGVLHVLFPDSIVRRHLGRGSLGSVIKSTVFGIPLPLCSCGVVPVATSLKKSGASKGSVVSFLISTPQIGADSFMITYSLLGWVFGVFRIIAALITALFAGVFINIFDKDKKADSAAAGKTDLGEGTTIDRLKSLAGYVEDELLGSIANSLVAGIIIAGFIGVAIPDGFFETYLGDTFLSMIIMMAVGIPMYVCASASTPIAASLIMKGISPGAALVFLLTGPATNAVNFTTVTKIVGKKSTFIYFAAIALVSLALGYLLNFFSNSFGVDQIIMHHQHDAIPQWMKLTGSILLLAMLLWYYIKTKIINRYRRGTVMDIDKISLNVKGMTCMHCANTVKKAVESVDGTSNVTIDLDGDRVLFESEDKKLTDLVREKIKLAGYEV